MKKVYKKHKNIKMPSAKVIIFFTLITSIIVITFSISKYESIIASKYSGSVAKWDISLNTNYNDYILFENNKENEHDFMVTVKSESEVSSKYDIEIQGLHKKYNAKLERGDYSVGYSINNNSLNIKNNNDEVSFDISKNTQLSICNGNNYSMEKYETTDNTHISIKNLTSNKCILDFTIYSNNEMKVIFKNCVEFLTPGKHEDNYNFRVSTISTEIPSACNIKLCALFEQID